MKFYWAIFIFSFITIVSFLPIHCYGIPKEDQLVYSSMKKISYVLQKKYGLTGGFCGCGKDNGFWKVIFIFHKRCEPLIIEQARALAVACTEDVINFINQEEKIRFNLRDYPFSTNNVDIDIIFDSKENQMVFHPFIGSLNSGGGRMFYSTFDPNYRLKKFSTIKETYEEALAIVRGTKGPCSSESDTKRSATD